jgi:hypothetical protein
LCNEKIEREDRIFLSLNCVRLLTGSCNGLVPWGIYLYITFDWEYLILMQKKIADHKRRVSRLNRYVFVVALLWVVTSFALILLSRSHHSNSAGPVPVVPDHALHSVAAVTFHSSVMHPDS